MRVAAMMTEEQLQQLLQQLQEEVEQRCRDQALQEEAAKQAEAQLKEEEARKSAELGEAEKSTEEKIEEIVHQNETTNMAFEQAGHQLVEDMETLTEKFEHKLDETHTETTPPSPQHDPSSLASHVAGFDAALLGGALGIGLGLQYLHSRIHPEPENQNTPPAEQLLEPESIAEPEQAAPPEPPSKPFLPPEPEDNIPASAEDRHEWAYQGIGDFGAISMTGKTSEQEMAQASMREYEQFKQEQQILDEAIANEPDPTRREALELRQKIEVAEYNEAMCLESARIEYVLADGEPSPTANRLEGFAERYHEEAEALNDEWAKHCVRYPDNYEPRDDEMAEAVTECRVREGNAWHEFEERAETDGWSPERREVEAIVLQQELDTALDMAFDCSMSSPTMSL
jgi:hypothetical protein